MNIYQIANPAEGEESFTTLHQIPSLRIEAIRSRLTQPGQLYDQEEDEWVVLIRGTAMLEIEGNAQLLKEGDSLFLKRHVRHRVLSTSDDALWIGVFSS